MIETFREAFPDVVIGFSSHDNGIAMALVAYMLGARVFEKHFTLNRAWKGTDQAFSLEPPGLRRVVRDLQRTRVALGDGEKRRYDSEVEPLHKMTKKLVAARDLPAGHVLTEADIAIKSPGDGGLRPYMLQTMIGRRIIKDLKLDDNCWWKTPSPLPTRPQTRRLPEDVRGQLQAACTRTRFLYPFGTSVVCARIAGSKWKPPAQ